MNNDYIKSPMNYSGGKYKLLPQILPLFPDNINVFFDLFAGGCNVGVNVNANRIICNDKLTPIINFYDKLTHFEDVNTVIEDIYNIIYTYELSNQNKDSYLELRAAYNSSKDPFMFYTLVAHSFSNQIRFNKKNEFNLPFGKRTFNKEMESNFIKFFNKIKELNIEFINYDFRDLKLISMLLTFMNKEDFLYCDPPYSKTTAAYNENNNWNKQDDIYLFKLLDKVNEQGIKFAMSNIYRTDWLKEWSKKYNIHFLDYNYKNCNYQKKDRSGNEQEVLITNYWEMILYIVVGGVLIYVMKMNMMDFVRDVMT